MPFWPGLTRSREDEGPYQGTVSRLPQHYKDSTFAMTGTVSGSPPIQVRASSFLEGPFGSALSRPGERTRLPELTGDINYRRSQYGSYSDRARSTSMEIQIANGRHRVREVLKLMSLPLRSASSIEEQRQAEKFPHRNRRGDHRAHERAR